VIPGLFSTYALQSSTYLTRHVTYRGPVECPWYDHLLAYQPVIDSSNCGLVYRQSLLVATDTAGEVLSVHEVFRPDGSAYNGSLTGVAVSVEHDVVWACGRVHDTERW
jgi:hypothetical protein